MLRELRTIKRRELGHFWKIKRRALEAWGDTHDPHFGDWFAEEFIREMHEQNLFAPKGKEDDDSEDEEDKEQPKQ